MPRLPGSPNTRIGSERSHSRGTAAASAASGKPKKSAAETWKALPEIIALLEPRKGLLLLGLALMAINRVAGLALPFSPKYFFDDVIGKHQTEKLLPLVLVVIGATIVQGITSFSLTQLLSKSAQRMITDMRKRIQAHIGRLPVTYYDSHKTGELVSRIMSDVEGIRNLIGTGLVEFLGGLMTAAIAFVILLKTSAVMTLLAFLILVTFGTLINKAFATIRPIFRARPKINAEVTGRLTESLGGVRVVKGYHAEEREENVFAGGVQRLLDNVLKTLTATSLMSLSGVVLMGLVSTMIMFLGARQILAGHMTLGTLVSYMAFLAMLVAPVFQIVAIGTQLTEAITGLERTREILNEKAEDEDAGRTVTIERINGEIVFDKVDFCLRHWQTGSLRYQFPVSAGNGDCTGRPFWCRKIHHHRTDCGILQTGSAAAFWWMAWTWPRVKLRQLPHAAWRCVAGHFSFRRDHSRKRGFRPSGCQRARNSRRLPHRSRRRIRGKFRRQIRHCGRRARRAPFWRTEAARVYRPSHSCRSAPSDSRRSHLEPGLRIRGAHSGRLALPDARPNYFRYRSPALNDSPRRTNPRRRSRAHHRTRHSRNRSTISAAATTTSTPASMAWNRIFFWLPARATARASMILHPAIQAPGPATLLILSNSCAARKRTTRMASIFRGKILG